jgi:hypothetical protein
VKVKFIKKDKKILIEIPNEICDLFNLKDGGEFEVKAVETRPSKLLISFLGDI